VLKIGEFARIGQVSAKTLRLYDEIGLLRPAFVDAQTGYRFYSVEQLPQLHRVLALKDLGFQLEAIVRLVQENPSPAELRGLLEQQRIVLAERVREEQARLARVEARLHQLEGRSPACDVVVRRVQARSALLARGPAVAPDVARALSQAVRALLDQHGLDDYGPWLHIYHEASEASEAEELSAGVLLDRGAARQIAQATPRSPVVRLPLVATMACVVHQGGYETRIDAYAALGRWIDDGGYRIVGPCREIYLQGPEAGAPITEIQLPVAQNKESGI
jgi:DNA-binding transcriptional MerR regulator